jgi:hypothetical protein
MPDLSRVSWLCPLTLLLLLGLCNVGCAARTTLTVAPGGSDTKGTGRPDAPFASLDRARDEIRQLRQAGKLPLGAVVVQVASGTYQLAKPFALTADDSGSLRNPITYRAAKDAQVRLVGGKVVEGWQPVTDPAILARLDPAVRGKVMQADLKAQGVTDYGGVVGGGLEVFFNDEAMTISRWPNEGFVKIMDLVPIKPIDVRGTKGDGGGQFMYDGDRPTRWQAEKDLWLEGYWFWDWADQRMKVGAIDTAKRIITLAEPQKHYYGYRKGQWYYAYNALCEIDQPNEWYLDRQTGILYFYPPRAIKPGSVVVSVLNNLITTKDVSEVTIQGFTLEACRSDAVVMNGGERCEIAGCVIRNTGLGAVTINGGRKNGVRGCDIYATAKGGITMTGGDRKTLTPAGLYADNNHVYNVGRWWRMYSGGINVYGVGNRVTHNLIDNCPHTAIFFGGNDHVIEYNEIHSVCYEANDGGAVYAGRNWTMRGTVISHNYLHHINGFEGRGCVGVYLDDQFSGTSIFGNLFVNVTRAAMIGGGRDCSIENNIFVDCNPATHVDARGLGWAKYEGEEWIKEAQEKGTILGTLYNKPPYSERYPKLINILAEDPNAPTGNVIARNICVGGRWGDFEAKAKPLVTFRDNLLDQDPRFMDAAHGDYRLKPDSPAWKLGFERLPIEKMGLYQDSRRASWPVVTKVRPMLTPPKPVRVVRSGPLPIFKVLLATAPVTVDGQFGPGEWPVADAARLMPVAQGIEGEPVSPASKAWLAHDGTALLVIVDNALTGGRAPSKTANWGTDDAVELSFMNPALGSSAPVLILRGYPNGTMQSSDEAETAAALVKRAGEGVAYKATQPGPGRWICEWRVPLASLGLDPAKVTKFAFNLSVRKPVEGLWVEWQGTRAHTWQANAAGYLEIVR